MSAVQRDRERFCELYCGAHSLLTAYARRRCVEQSDADDVVSEVFVVVWRRIKEVPDGNDALPWLYGVARRVLSNSRRTEQRRSRLQSKLRGVRETYAEVESKVVGRASAAQGLVVLARLKEPDQEVLRLSGWEGLSNGEIATALGCSDNAATLRLHRARRRFDKEYAKEVGRLGKKEGTAPQEWRHARREAR